MKRRILITVGMLMLVSLVVAGLVANVDRVFDKDSITPENKAKLSELGINNWTYTDYQVDVNHTKRCLSPDRRFSNYSLGCSGSIDVSGLTDEEKLTKLSEWEKYWVNKVGEVERERDARVSPEPIREGQVTISNK